MYITHKNTLVFGFIFGFVSVVILKPEWILKIFSLKIKNRNLSEGAKNFSKKLALKKLAGKNLIILPRVLFFNVLYYMFPIFLVIIPLEILLLSLGLISISDNFVQIAVLVGIASGFFQYYIKRYEEKVQQKILSKFGTISKFIRDEAIFIKFENFLSQSGNNEFETLKDKIKGEILNIPLLERYRLHRRPGGTIIQPVFLETFHYEPYSYIENLLEEEHRKTLREAYKEFFEGIKSKAEKDLEKKEHLFKEFGILLLLNLNFIPEAEPEFLQMSSEIEKQKEPETFGEFLNNTILEITNKVLTKIAL